MTEPTTDVKVTVPFRDREIEVQSITDGQILIMSKILRNLQREGVPFMSSVVDVAKVVDIIESAIVNPADWEHIEDLMLKRELGTEELIRLIGMPLIKGEVTEKPKVRRGRPPKRAPK